MKTTKVINLIGPSGSGKSTTALGLTYELKKLGYKCELVTEWIKEEIFNGNLKVVEDQIYIFSKQLRRQRSLINQDLDFIITDSPLILSSFYGEKYSTSSPALDSLVFNEFHKFENITFFLKRTVPFDPVGRFETEKESDEDYLKLKEFLRRQEISHFPVNQKEKTDEILKYFNKR